MGENNKELKLSEETAKQLEQLQRFTAAMPKINLPDISGIVGISKELGKAIDIFTNAYNKNYDTTISEYGDYFKAKGIIIPKSIDDFLHWGAIVYPDEPLSFLVEAAKTPYYYKMYHEYKERVFNNPDWTRDKEIEYLKENYNNDTGTAEPKPLSDLICHDNGEQIVEAIKTKYRNIKGKHLKLLIIAMQELTLLPKSRIVADYYRRAQTEFSWNIGSYQSINDYEYNPHADKEEYLDKIEFLKTLITNTK